MRPLVPEDLELPSFRRDCSLAILRAAVACGRAKVDKTLSPLEHLEAAWPHDKEAALLLTKAAAPPLTMASTPALVAIARAIFPILAPFSAAATLFRRGLEVSFGRYGAIVVPNIGQVTVAFVAGAAPKPVVQGLSTGARLDVHKAAGIAVMSSELFEIAGVEELMRSLLGESGGQALDAAVFSAIAASAAQPAGLLNGITALTAAAATPGSDDAFVADIKALGDAVGSVAGAGGITFIGSPGQIESTHYRAPGIEPAYMPFIASSAVAPGTLVAVANNAVVSATSPPEFETSTQATLQMDNAPTTLMAGATQSMWQTASVAVKMIYNASWALRSPKGAAWIQGVAW